MELKKETVLDFLGKHKLMSVATVGNSGEIAFPWIANVYPPSRSGESYGP